MTDHRAAFREACRSAPVRVKAWRCGDPGCRVLHASAESARVAAWLDCAHGGSPRREYCQRCADERSAQVEAARRSKAREVAWADYEGEYVVLGDEFVLRDNLEDVLADMDPDERPAWVWGTEPLTPSVDAGHLAEDLHHAYLSEESYDNVCDLPGWDALEAAVAAFNTLQIPTSWEPDFGVAVILPPGFGGA